MGMELSPITGIFQVNYLCTFQWFNLEPIWCKEYSICSLEWCHQASFTVHYASARVNYKSFHFYAKALWLQPKWKTRHNLIIYQHLSCSIFWHTQVALTALTTDSCKDQTKNLTGFNVLVCFVIQLQLLQNRKCLLLNCNEELFGTMG